MSRRYDEYYDETYIPLSDELLFNGYDTIDGVDYARIKGQRDYYVNTNGEVISCAKRTPIRMKTYTNQHGHHYVDLPGFGKKNKCLVHRLVAEAFIPNPHNYPIVRHLDDDPDNNHISNLEWGTQLDNRHDCIRNGNDFRKEVYCYEDDKIFRSCASAADYYGVSRATITRACQGKVYAVDDKHFCYADEIDAHLKDPEWLKPHKGYKPVVAISPEGKRYSFSSRMEASEKLGIPDCGISSVLTGHLKHTHGWRFEEGR